MTSRRKRNLILTAKWGSYAMMLLVAATLQSIPGFLKIAGVRPLFILPLCLAVAIYEGEYAGAFFGMVGGLLWDWTAGRIGGLMALGLLVLCFMASLVVELYLRVNFVNFILVTGACSLFIVSMDFLFYYLMPAYSGAAHRYFTVILPMAVYTAVLSPIAMICVRWVKEHIVPEG